MPPLPSHQARAAKQRLKPTPAAPPGAEHPNRPAASALATYAGIHADCSRPGRSETGVLFRISCSAEASAEASAATRLSRQQETSRGGEGGRAEPCPFAIRQAPLPLQPSLSCGTPGRWSFGFRLSSEGCVRFPTPPSHHEAAAAPLPVGNHFSSLTGGLSVKGILMPAWQGLRRLNEISI